MDKLINDVLGDHPDPCQCHGEPQSGCPVCEQVKKWRWQADNLRQLLGQPGEELDALEKWAEDNLLLAEERSPQWMQAVAESRARTNAKYFDFVTANAELGGKCTDMLVERDELTAELEALVKYCRDKGSSIGTNRLQAIIDKRKKSADESLLKDADNTIDDGHGNIWSVTCPECGKDAMHIVRPGKVQCGECE